MDLKQMKVSDSLSQDGVWVDLDETSKVKLARFGNAKFKSRLRALMSPYKRMIDNDTMSDVKADELLVIALAETVVLDWKGLSLDGKEISYSVGTVMKILSDPAFIDFREMIVSMSRDMELYREEELKDAVEK